ncbi:MT0933-like antitoxin protein [Mycolicibacterium rutilum]|uniref:MT0933-like antitoxin protein n=1 Tax=Mycolicibacterium rutilum TaxID=370526 RepID=A0A1H6JQP5_MYCRU|nr:antitoxin [Mycolicibacterium rutilum]SEH64467.1 MT0933-like antitoxin protein [Mycolicibacterium rutilum]
MSFLDKLKNWVSKNPDKAGSAIDKAGDFFDQKTQGKYTQHVDKAQDAARNYVTKNNPQGAPQPQQPAPPPPQQQPPTAPPTS